MRVLLATVAFFVAAGAAAPALQSNSRNSGFSPSSNNPSVLDNPNSRIDHNICPLQLQILLLLVIQSDPQLSSNTQLQNEIFSDPDSVIQSVLQSKGFDISSSSNNNLNNNNLNNNNLNNNNLDNNNLDNTNLDNTNLGNTNLGNTNLLKNLITRLYGTNNNGLS